MYLILVIALLCYVQLSGSSNVGVLEMPTINSNDVVDFYYCETSLPFNTPKDIV